MNDGFDYRCVLVNLVNYLKSERLQELLLYRSIFIDFLSLF